MSNRKPEPGNGYLDGSGVSPFAARADHEHEHMADDTKTVKAVKKTIKTTDWTSKAADVPFTEGTFIGYEVAFASKDVADTAVLVLSTVGTNKLTFGCTTDPTANVDVYVLYL